MDTASTATRGAELDTLAAEESSALAPAEKRLAKQELLAALLLDARRDAAGYLARYDAGLGAE